MPDNSKEIMLLLEEGVKAALEKNPEGVLKLLAQLQNGPVVKSYGEADGQKLQAAYDDFFQTHTFQPRQLVKWKPGLKNKKLPKEGQPAIVMAVLEETLDQVERDPGSPYFREPLDIVLGVTDEDGDFMTFHFDKRRFEPYNTD
jgi:hypothetical protein